MTDETPDQPLPAPDASDGATAAAARVLDEQQIRIAALRAAVLGGSVPDDEAFDYEAFFARTRRGDAS